MIDYVPPINDFRFLITRVLGFEAVVAELGHEVDADLALTILEEAGRFCTRRLQPLNRTGDEHGSRLGPDGVITPPGFKEAYRDFAAAGWTSLTGPLAAGGQDLPFVIQLCVDEMVSATNVSFGLFPGLSRGAVEAIAAHASEELKERFLPSLVSGEWTGVMALTESNAGTDLGLLRTKAEPTGNGSFRITGTKIFISSGDHDFGGNIVHLVLARLPGAPSGVKGISLFLVPKLVVDADGSSGERNGVSVGALEAKMGIHAQPTCVINYDGAEGWLVGEANRGLSAMFTMMNAERLFVGIQGLGLASASYQQAVAYARERLQGRGADGGGPVPILEHADVRRMLLGIRAFVEAGRAAAMWTALEMQKSERHPDPEARRLSANIVAILTPVIKAAFTDMGFESVVAAQQVLGGQGYIREWGLEQAVRDARIAQIYEGTNGVQAMDLVGRKLDLDGGKAVAALFDIFEKDLATVTSCDVHQVVVARLRVTLELARAATIGLQAGDLNDRGASATAYLRLVAILLLGWMWVRMVAAIAGHETADADATRATALFFAERVLTQAHSLAADVGVGASPVMALAADAF